MPQVTGLSELGKLLLGVNFYTSTLAFSCKVVHEKLWTYVYICKSYIKKITGTFFMWTQRFLNAIWFLHAYHLCKKEQFMSYIHVFAILCTVWLAFFIFCMAVQRLSLYWQVSLQCESKKVEPLKLFATFSLRLSIFPWNFASMLPAYIYTFTNFGRFIFIF